MTIFNILELIGGLALFLFGMHILGESLTTISGGKMEQLLERLSSNKFKGLLLGTVITALIQSSSATTVMVVALVNSGVMKLRQAVPIIMGANLGTTATGWILSLSGISGESFFVQMLKPSSFTPILAIIGIVLIFTGKTPSRRIAGNALLGFTILMFGMSTMSGSVAPLQHVPAFQEAFQAFSNPVLGVGMGALLTAIVQSSSATTGILQALSTTGAISFASAVPLIMGQNIGTCITAILSTIGANRNAKRTSVVHLSFNVIGTTIFIILFYTIHRMIGFAFYNDPVNEVSIALVHTIFNFMTVLFLFPFSDLLVKLSKRIIPMTEDMSDEDDFEQSLRLLDARFLGRPGFAIEQAFNTLNKMMATAVDAVNEAIDLLADYDYDKHQRIKKLEDQVDRYEEALLEYTLQITGSSLNNSDNDKLAIILHAVADIERLGDYAFKLANQAQIKAESPTCFSDQADEELALYSDAVKEIIKTTEKTLDSLDLESSMKVNALERIINKVDKSLDQKHIERLKSGVCNIHNGITIVEIYNSFERIGDHCDNISNYVYEFSEKHNRRPNFNATMNITNPIYNDYMEGYQNHYLLPDVVAFKK